MKIIVFIGPSISISEARDYLNADYRPPARQGDVYRACLENPSAIVIIDGFFEQVPSVWHKEILYAMSQGIHVFGAASMGALRAAELSVFGMEGKGEVFSQFEQGILEDDDEVAVVHGPKELGYVAVNDAMVNIRATLKSAMENQILSPEQFQDLIEQAKNTWYPERSFSSLLTYAKQTLCALAYKDLAEFIEHQKADVKYLDAKALLNWLAQSGQNSIRQPKQVNYAFQPTDAWQNMVEQVEANDSAYRADVDFHQLLIELRLDGKADYWLTQARQRQALLDNIQLNEAEVTPKSLLKFAHQQDAIVSGQLDYGKLQSFIHAQQLDPQQFDKLMKEQSRLLQLDVLYPQPLAALLQVLRLSRKLGEMVERIEYKQQYIRLGGDWPLNQISTDAALSWYFEHYLKQTTPADMTDFARLNGFADEAEFTQQVCQHYCWAHSL